MGRGSSVSALRSDPVAAAKYFIPSFAGQRAKGRSVGDPCERIHLARRRGCLAVERLAAPGRGCPGRPGLPLPAAATSSYTRSARERGRGGAACASSTATATSRPDWFEPVESLLFQMDRYEVEHAILVQDSAQPDNTYQIRVRPPISGPLRLGRRRRRRTARCRPDTLERLAGRGAVGVRLRQTSRSPGRRSARNLASGRSACGYSVSCIRASLVLPHRGVRAGSSRPVPSPADRDRASRLGQ